MAKLVSTINDFADLQTKYNPKLEERKHFKHEKIILRKKEKTILTKDHIKFVRPAKKIVLI